MDTIAAIATTYGIGSIAIVRVCGPESLKIAKEISLKKEIPPRYALLCDLYDHQNDLIDRAILIYFKSPKSFTGEDVVEFQCHGGTVVASMILDEVIKRGARLANAGEFSKRAFLNGKIDLTEAEAIAKIIETKSLDGAKILAKQLKGELKVFVEEIRESLIEILAFVEVNIDYAEEDLPLDLTDQIAKKLSNLEIKLNNTLLRSKAREGLIEGFKVSIIGKPNVGKSSLLNSLLSFNRAIISEIAGTTRDTIEENIKIGTHLIKIVDTAGIRGATDEIEKIGISRSIASVEESEIVLAMFDISSEFDKNDESIIELIEKFKDKKEIICILNKNDKEKVFDTSKVSKYNPLYISCKKDTNLVLSRLQEYLDHQKIDNEIILSSKRQVNAVAKALTQINESLQRLEDGELELFAYHINEAIANISSITRAYEKDEMLDKMFSSFCLGK